MSDIETNIESENFEDGFLGAEVEVEDRAFGPQFPTVQWVNGNPKAKLQGGIAFTGGFFISADQGISKDKLEAVGFTAYSLITNDGTEVIGFAATELVVSPIRYRRCWQITKEGQLPRRFGWDEYDAAQESGKPRGVAHILVAIQGLDEAVLLSFRGMTAPRLMGQGKVRGIVPNYSQKILGQAKKIARAAHKDKTYPLCAFRITIGAQKDEAGNPVFSEVGSTTKNLVTYPTWRDEPVVEVDEALLKRLFVGNQNFALYQDWHKSADEWVDAWNTDALQGFRAKRAGVAAAGAEPAADGTPGDNQMTF